MTDEVLYQIALTKVPNIGTVQAKILVNIFGSATAIFKARKSDLEKIENIGEVKAASIKNHKDFDFAERELAFIEKYKIQTFFLNAEGYPKRLLNCYDPPTLLYYRGNADLNAPRIVAIIGTRNNTDYGKQVTEQLVSDLQSQHVLVVSGLAYGIDAIAHKAAVHNQLPTVGVLAHGLDSIYPPQHAALAKQMLFNGGLLTEFRKETLPERHNFPQRNRIVAGMCDATVVVETAAKGGSMITAGLASGYNRTVFAFPGKTTDVKSAGCNYLIKHNKAVLLENGEQLMQMLGWSPQKLKRKEQRALFISLTNDEQVLVNVLKDRDAVHIDEIFLKSGLSSSAIAAAMLNLEFQNVVSSQPGKMYRLL